MCVLALAWRVHPRWRLVVAGNRDELHARPAAPLARWADPDHLIAGRDLLSGGTWLGVSEQGRFAVITNLRDPGAAVAGRISRGSLVTSLLSGENDPARAGRVELADFNPFNLICTRHDQAWFLSNRPAAVRRPLDPGLYGMSNGMLDEPWPKTVRLKAHLAAWMTTPVQAPESLLDALSDETPADEASALAPSGAARSPIFIRNPAYGTRASTVVAVDQEGEGVIIERRFGPTGEPDGETRLTFTMLQGQ